jgi:hypothetical protein
MDETRMVNLPMLWLIVVGNIKDCLFWDVNMNKWACVLDAPEFKKVF